MPAKARILNKYANLFQLLQTRSCRQSGVCSTSPSAIMTTNYASQTYTIPEAHVPLYAPSQQPSPTNSASPTSPRMNDYLQHTAPNPYKQLRPLKSPLYVPAVLRPTEHFPKPSLMTPPKSLHGSLDSLQDGEELLPEDAAPAGGRAVRAGECQICRPLN